MRNHRVQKLDFNVAGVGAEVIVGRAFAFIPAALFKRPAWSWIDSLRRTPGQAEILSLLGPEAVRLPGATVQPVDLQPLRLALVTSDKTLYREAHDIVRLVVLDLGLPRADVSVTVSTGGTEVRRIPVRLNAHGAGVVPIADLDCGHYEARLAHMGGRDSACGFTVAAYQLAPLRVAIVEQGLQGDTLTVTLRLTSFGHEVDGDVRLELNDRVHPQEQVLLQSLGGLVHATFAVRGAGPYTIHVQLLSSPSRTATIRVDDTQMVERKAPPFSTLGTEVCGSVVPGAASIDVRGLHLQEGVTHNTPFRLERVDTRRARLTATCPIHDAVVVVVEADFPGGPPAMGEHPAQSDLSYQLGEQLFYEGRWPEARAVFLEYRPWCEPAHPYWAYFIACCLALEGQPEEAIEWLRIALRDGYADLAAMAADTDLAALRGDERFQSWCRGGRRQWQRTELHPGDVWDIDVPGPTSVLAIGAWIDGGPWEGWAATVSPSLLKPRLTTPSQVAPGETVSIEIDDVPSASIYLVVKDARLGRTDTLKRSLAHQIQNFVAEVGNTLACGKPCQTLTDALSSAVTPETVSVATSRLTTADRMDPSTVRRTPRPDASPPQQAAVLAADEPEVLFAGLLFTVEGRAQAQFTTGPAAADYVVDALILSEGDWAFVEGRFTAARTPYASLSVPPYLAEYDVALGRLLAGSSASGVRVRVTRNGVPIPLLHRGRAVGTAFETSESTVEVHFLVRAGVYVGSVEAVDGSARHHDQRRVERPGQLQRLGHTLRLLEPGHAIAVNEDPRFRRLTIIPGVEGPLRRLLHAIASCEHRCCEQTAASVMASVIGYLHAKSDHEQAMAEAAILTGIQRQRRLHLPGLGFKLYAGGPDVPDPYGREAAQHLLYLELLKNTQRLSPALREGIQQGLVMAEDALQAYDVNWPVTHVTSCQTAYLAIRFRGQVGLRERVRKRVRGEAADFVRQFVPSVAGVAGRVELAYAAAVLLHLGENRGRAVELANAVYQDLGPDGKLPSTLDSVAAIALTAELHARGIVGPGAARVNGRSIPTREALSLTEEIREVGALAGVLCIEVLQQVEEDWTTSPGNLPVKVALEKEGHVGRRFSVGDILELRVKLETGYQAGDLVWVCLPDALTRIAGGGEKRFSVDFAGQSEVRMVLAATRTTVGSDGQSAPQRFAVCVRNMFDEGRCGNPGLLDLTVVEEGVVPSPASRAISLLHTPV